MYAVIETGGKQYRVQEGDVITVEKLKNVEAGDKVTFENVLFISGDGDVQVGTPFLKLPFSEKSWKVERARRSSSTSTSPRRITTRSRVTDSLTQWLKSLESEKIRNPRKRKNQRQSLRKNQLKRIRGNRRKHVHEEG